MGDRYMRAKFIEAPEARRVIEMRSRQITDIKEEWQEIEWAIQERKNLMLCIPKDMKRIIEVDNFITERAQEYARATIYIDLT